MDAKRLFTDPLYKTLMYEYHGFVSYILRDINRYSIYSSSVRFSKDSVIDNHIDEFMRMMRETFPEFDITIETIETRKELDENEMCVTVDWTRYKETIKYK